MKNNQTIDNTLQKIELLLKQHLKIPIFKIFCIIGRYLSFLTNKEIQNKKISKILILVGGGIGDVIRIFPIIKPLKDKFPYASITLASPLDHQGLKLFPHTNIISESIIFDVSKKHKNILSKLLFIRTIRKKSFDLIICPQIGLGMIEFAIISFLINAPYRIGYTKKGAGFLYTSKTEFQDNESIYQQHLTLLKTLLIQPDSNGYYLKVTNKDMSFAHSFLKKHNITHRDLTFSVSPIVMADRKNKSPQHNRPLSEYRSWPEGYYIELINKLIHIYKAKVIVLGDKIPQEGNLSRLLLNTKNPNIITAVEQTTIGQSAAIINLSNVFISNDSGLLHIAIAIKKPCIGIFGSTSPKQVLPAVDYCIPIWKGLKCSPCFIHQPIPNFKCNYNIECLESITVEDVLQAIKSLLEKQYINKKIILIFLLIYC